jgi:hypothetical protein
MIKEVIVMGVIKQKGVPTRKTKGAVGDIYINTQNGDKYKCTFAYNDGVNWECTWYPVDKDAVVKEEKVVEPKQPVHVETVKVEEPIDHPDAEVEPTDNVKQRTNYSKHFNK